MLGGMGGGGQLALNQLLVVMDGIDSPPFFRRVLTNRINTLLDALYLVPRRVGKLSLRIPRARPPRRADLLHRRDERALGPARPGVDAPGRMGRHVHFRTPTKDDRKDVFDLYLDKVAHDPELDAAKRRDEIARITNGYSPAMIDQVCSMALTNAQHEGKVSFDWEHLVQAMTTLESGTAVNVSYPDHELRSVAIHEAGHAVTAHVYRPASSRAGVDPDARRLARPSPDIRARGAVQPLAARGDGSADPRPRCDGGRERLLRREHGGCRRRPADRHRPRRVDGRRVRHGARASRDRPRHAAQRPSARAAARGGAARRSIMRRFEEIGVQIMNREASNGDAGAQRDRRTC